MHALLVSHTHFTSAATLFNHIIIIMLAVATIAHPMQDILGPLQGLPTLLIQSGADEAVPQELRDNGSMLAAGQRMRQAILQGPNRHDSSATENLLEAASPGAGVATSIGPPGSAAAVGLEVTSSEQQWSEEDRKLVQLHVVEGAGHACKGHEQQLAQLVSDFLQQLP